MLKRDIKYMTFDDPPKEIVEPFYFNLTRSELIELDSTYEGGVGAVFTRIQESQNQEEGVKQFKKFILAAYGIKSDDGKRFVKSDQIREEFTQHAAYDALFVELATNEQAQSEFIIGVMPKEFTQELASELGVKPSSLKDAVGAALAPPPSPPTVQG